MHILLLAGYKHGTGYRHSRGFRRSNLQIGAIRAEPARLTRAPVAVAKSAGEQLKRVRGAGKGAKAAAWRKDCDASGVKSFYDSGVRL